jgi:4-hydroxybenzoyl-CoA thioesterase
MVFHAHLEVCFGDIDNAGIVYYPRFLHYFHVALEEFFSMELGIDYSTVVNVHRLAFPTVRIEADFRNPLSFGDHIEVDVLVLALGRTSITWGYKVYKSGERTRVIAEGRNVTVSIHMDTFEKMEIPDWLRKSLEAYQRSCA